METFKHALQWAAYRFTSTVLDDIWPGVLFFTGIATMVVTVSHFTTVNLGINSIMLTVIGTVVSLVVSFKTNNSYARWWDGRNVWSNITTNSRQLAMLIWLQVPNVPPPKPDDKKSPPDKQVPKAESSASMKTFSTAPQAQEHHVIGHKPEDEQSTEEDKTQKADEDAARQAMRGLIEKKSYIGLIQAFSVAMKHALRGEDGPFYSDLYSLIAFLPKYNTSVVPPVQRQHVLALWQHNLPRQSWATFTDHLAIPLTTPAHVNEMSESHLGQREKGLMEDQQLSAEQQRRAEKHAAPFLVSIGGSNGNENGDQISQKAKVNITKVELMPPRHPPPVKIWDLIPPLRLFKIVSDWFRFQKLKDNERVKGGKRRRSGTHTNTEIPQEILMYISSYLSDLIRRGLLNTSFISPYTTCILELQKGISDLEKISTTPIPSAYTIQLRLTVWAYLLFLPFQVYQYIGWVTIPATAIAATIYLGFLELSNQIECPFNYDQSDLDLDKYVFRIAHQIAQITAFPATVDASQVVLSHLNQPFLPSLTLSAPEILGVNSRVSQPTEKGSSAGFKTYSSKHKEEDKTKSVARSMRDIELVLNENWRSIVAETEDTLCKPRDQLENRTGLEVGVLAL